MDPKIERVLQHMDEADQLEKQIKQLTSKLHDIKKSLYSTPDYLYSGADTVDIKTLWSASRIFESKFGKGTPLHVEAKKEFMAQNIHLIHRVTATYPFSEPYDLEIRDFALKLLFENPDQLFKIIVENHDQHGLSVEDVQRIWDNFGEGFLERINFRNVSKLLNLVLFFYKIKLPLPVLERLVNVISKKKNNFNEIQSCLTYREMFPQHLIDKLESIQLMDKMTGA